MWPASEHVCIHKPLFHSWKGSCLHKNECHHSFQPFLFWLEQQVSYLCKCHHTEFSFVCVGIPPHPFSQHVGSTTQHPKYSNPQGHWFVPSQPLFEAITYFLYTMSCAKLTVIVIRPTSQMSGTYIPQSIGLNVDFPLNVHLLTLERLDHDHHLLRLEHQYPIDEAPLNTTVNVTLEVSLFSHFSHAHFALSCLRTPYHFFFTHVAANISIGTLVPWARLAFQLARLPLFTHKHHLYSHCDEHDVLTWCLQDSGVGVAISNLSPTWHWNSVFIDREIFNCLLLQSSETYRCLLRPREEQRKSASVWSRTQAYHQALSYSCSTVSIYSYPTKDILNYVFDMQSSKTHRFT